MSFIGDLMGVGGIAEAGGKVVESVKDVLLKTIPDADKRLEAETQIRQSVEQGLTAQATAMQSVMTADSQSDSKFTKNARPIVVYWSLSVITLVGALGLVGHSQPVIDALSNVPQGLWDLVKYGVGIFTAGRTIEKTAAPIASAVIKHILTRK